MFKRTVFIVTLAAFAAVLTMAVTPAKAEIHVKFSADSLHLEYNLATRALDITSQYTVEYKSTMQAFLYDTIADNNPDWTILNDASSVDATTFVIDLQVNNLNGIWHADGVWTMKDKNGLAASATFTSTNVETIPDFGVNPAFIVQGLLTPNVGESILVGGDPWTYEGDINKGVIGDGLDGTTATITRNDSGPYGSGTMVTTHFLLGAYVDTDTFLTTNHTGTGALDGGWASGTIIPVPAAVVLGFIGLGMVGVRMRKHA